MTHILALKYVALAYLVLGLILFLVIVVKAWRWDGSHDNFISYYFGVVLDLQGTASLLLQALIVGALWPIYLIALLRSH